MNGQMSGRARRAISRRAQQTAIVDELLLTIFKTISKLVGDGPVLTAPALWPIRIADMDGDAPPTITEIARQLGEPRETIRRALLWAEQHGVITKMGDGYTSNPDFVEGIDNGDIEAAIEAIHRCSDRLRALQ